METHLNSPEAKLGKLNLPLKLLPEGQSFIIPCNAINGGYLRAFVSNFNVKSEFIFRVIRHKKENIYEVANIGKGLGLQCLEVPYNVVDSSPQASAMTHIKGKTLYPFSDLKEGKSFVIPIINANEKSLKVLCSVQSRKYNKKFVLIKHEESGIYEIACLKKTQVTFYDNSAAA